MTNIRIALAVLCSMLYLFPPIPVSAQEAEGDLTQSMYEASESYVEFDPISDEQFSEIVSNNDESESEQESAVVNDVNDSNVDNVENVEEVENTDSTENADEVENKGTEQIDNETETDQNDNEQKTETDSEQKENVSNEQENKNEQEQESSSSEQEETVNIEQLYEVQVYILGILVFFVVCFILRMIYKFFNMFFPI
ncbi:hypothetical protein KFE18_10850 [Clostridiaceae bacterium Marseille-Q4143]|nr:hypothetical protein KFE18_10850 [Clostridiaceae bacterium Marseille-Q4143]